MIAAGYDLDRVLTAGRPRPGRQLLLRRHRPDRRPAAARRQLRRPRRPHAEPGDALAQRHGAADRRPPPRAQAPGVQRDRLLLIGCRSSVRLHRARRRRRRSQRGADVRRARCIALYDAPGTESALSAITSASPVCATTSAAGPGDRRVLVAVALGVADLLELGPGQAGAQRRDVDAGAAHLLVQALGEARDVRLRGGVDGEQRRRLEAGDARHVEQPAASGAAPSTRARRVTAGSAPPR